MEQVLWTTLLSPMVLAFGLGVFAAFVKSDLYFPDQIYTALSIYLLLAIGLKGGVALSVTPTAHLWLPILGTIGISLLIPLWIFFFLYHGRALSAEDSAALAAHYGSVSAVTFMTVLSYLESRHQAYEAFMPALLVLMEIPAIVIALYLGQRRIETTEKTLSGLRELMVSKSVLLLIGGLFIGFITGKEGFAKVSSFFVDPFQGVLVLFLLELGLVAGRHFQDIRHLGLFFIGFGVIVPLLNGVLGLLIGKACGFSLGGACVLSTMAASASYIAAPAAVRAALPSANPSYYLTASLAITFPFNLSIGIPLYYLMATYLYQ